MFTINYFFDLLVNKLTKLIYIKFKNSFNYTNYAIIL